jgi:hypothetical protein
MSPSVKAPRWLKKALNSRGNDAKKINPKLTHEEIIKKLRKYSEELGASPEQFEDFLKDPNP